MFDTDIGLINLIPQIKRARDYYLYDNDGNRFIDLFQNYGHSFLGHKAQNVPLAMKNVISRGLIFDLPSVYKQRLKKALSGLFPEFKSFLIAPCIDSALRVFNQHSGQNISLKDIIDPLSPENDKKEPIISYWRPFQGDDIQQSEAIVPILPFSVSGSPSVICVKDEINFENEELVSPVLLAGMIRTIYDLKQYKKPLWLVGNLLNESKSWIRKGFYIFPGFEKEKYKDVFLEFLSNRIVLSPSCHGPSIFPSQISPGELNRLLRLFNSIPR